jgi:hypothetical protein
MNPGDILTKLLEDPDEQKRAHQLVADMNVLRERLVRDRANVSDAEILDAIRKQFDLDSSSDFLSEVSWLIKGLSFTSLVIPSNEIPSAWRKFQEAKVDLIPMALDDYPILEGIAYWYFQNREESHYGAQHMLEHALAIYEYLVQQVRGWEASEEYADLFTHIGMDLFYLYYGLRNKERAKFYAQLLEMEYLAGRLDSEDFLSIQELVGVIHNAERTKESEREQILQLQWHTITDRERELEERDQRLQALERRQAETVTRASTQDDITQASDRVSRVCGPIWEQLHPETRKYLALGEAFAQPALSERHSDISPGAFFKALNSELTARIFRPSGSLELEIIKRLGVYSPVALLIEFFRNISLGKGDQTAIRGALNSVGKESVLCSPHNIDQMIFLRHHRNRIEHPSPHGRPYSHRDLESLLRAVWHTNWLISFLQHLHSSHQGTN